jgi:hypothetical protein
MAPEQAAGDDVDERPDVDAIGAMLYHLIGGAIPHEGKTLDQVIRRVLAGEITPLTTREPRAPTDLAAVVAKAMARDPSRRYPTAKELADDLRRFQTGQLVAALARPTALPLALALVAWIALGPARRPLRARLGEAALVAVACLLAIAPWTMRNHRVSGAWIPLTSGAGAALWDGNNPLVATDPRYRGGAVSLREVEPWASSFRGMSEVEIDRHAATEARAWLGAHRDQWPRLIAAKLLRFFRATSETAVSGSAAVPGSWLGNLARAIDPLFVTYGLLLPFFAGAALLALLRPRHSPLFAPAVAVLVQAALAAVYWGSLRFRAPVEPAIIVLGVSGALAAWVALRHRATAR